MKLTSATTLQMRSHLINRAEMPVFKTPGGSSRHIECVLMYLCPGCGEPHHCKSDAENCCDPEEDEDEDPIECPVCGSACDDHREAASCCLWKDLDAPTRWKVADAVEAGVTWTEALQLTDAFTGLPT